MAWGDDTLWQVQHLWLSPRPGWFLGLVWIISRPGSVLWMNWEAERAAALDRVLFVIDPRADQVEVERIRRQFDEMERTARGRYRWSQLANVLFCAWPVVFLVVAVSGADTDGGSTDGLDPALAATIVYLLLVLPVSVLCDGRSRRSVRTFEEFDAPNVLRSRRLGSDQLVVRQLSRADMRSAGDQRQLVDILWRIAEADRARREYLDSVDVLDDGFAAVLRRVEDAEAELRVWSATAPPTSKTGLDSRTYGF